MSTILKDKIVTTKTIHRCFSCLRTFPPKTKMNIQVGICDGDFGTTYTCLDCIEIMSFTKSDEVDNSYPEGFVFEMGNQGESINDTITRLLKTK